MAKQPGIYKLTIYPEKSPGLINDDMIEDALKHQIINNDIAALQLPEKIQHDKINILRLEQRNILRIDHLWMFENLQVLSLAFNKIDKINNLEMLTSLKDLNLSFNYIEKIENLNTLTSLEILSLFNNKITKIENLEALKNLMILSIGNNKIENKVGIEQFRFLKKLKSLNLEGNPMAERENSFRDYIAALLPDLMYYNYSCITEEESKRGKELYVRELDKIIELEKETIEEMEIKAQQKLDQENDERLFTENLRGFQFFNYLFSDPRDLKTINYCLEPENELLKTFKIQVSNITNYIIKLSTENEIKVNTECKIFDNDVDFYRKKAQEESQRLINEFLERKIDLFNEARVHFTVLETAAHKEDKDNTDDYDVAQEKFENISNNIFHQTRAIWVPLTEIETKYFEGFKIVLKQLSETLQNYVELYMTEVISNFEKLRELTTSFVENLGNLISIDSYKIVGNYDIVKKSNELDKYLKNKATLYHFPKHLLERQLKRINHRENELNIKINKWLYNLTEAKDLCNVKRNRERIMEIMHFSSFIENSFEELQFKVRDEVIKKFEHKKEKK